MDENETGYLDGDDDNTVTYSGPIRYITVYGSNEPLITFPAWRHEVVLHDNSVEWARTEDLQEGMALQVHGRVGIILKIEEGLYHGLMDGTFLGELPEEEPLPFKIFERKLYADGRISWKCKGPKDAKPKSVS